MRLLTVPEVLARVGMPRSTWYDYRARGDFPAPIKIFDSRIALWRSDDVEQWCKQRSIESRRHKDP